MQTGISDFKEFIKNNYYYVDKTLFIEELITKGNQAILFARPRGFGKTLNLSMLKYYFDIRQNSLDLFKGLKIEKSSTFKRYLNKYPTIYLTFKEIKSLSSWDEICESIRNIISKLYKEHDYLLESVVLDEYDKKVINKMIRGEADLYYYKSSLYILTQYLFEHYNKRVLVLLDDHDIAANPFYDEDTYENVSNFLDGLMSSTFKGNKYLHMGVITGIFKIPLNSIFSGANNIDIVNILDDRFIDKFGFTENEVLDALKHFNMKEKIEEIRKWYSYTFGNNVIYNPLSIANYINKKELKNYWANINEDLLIKNLLINSNFVPREALGELLAGNSINTDIVENIMFRQLDEYTYVWSLLAYSGYLDFIEDDNYDHWSKYIVSIPNQEVRNFYIQVLEDDFNKKVPNGYKIMDSIVKGDIEKFKKLFVKEISDILSNYSIRREFEYTYQLLLIGLLVSLKDSYEVKINKKFEYGRYSIYLIPNNKERLGYIIEFKEVEDKSLEDEAKDALNQIESKKYSLKLKSRGVNNIIALGIAIKGKKVFIKEKKII